MRLPFLGRRTGAKVFGGWLPVLPPFVERTKYAVLLATHPCPCEDNEAGRHWQP